MNLSDTTTIIRCNKAIRISKEYAPIAEISSHTSCRVETINAYGDRFETLSDLVHLLKDKSGKNHHHPLTGPISIPDAHIGDVLRVDILAIKPEEMAQSLSRSAGIDPLSEPLFGDRNPIIGKMTKKSHQEDYEKIVFSEHLLIPSSPMIGIIGTAPHLDYIKTGHAGQTGGNLDIPFVREGASIYLPVQVENAYLFIGDSHSAQAYGELGGTAMECSATVDLSISVCTPNEKLFEKDPYLAEQQNIAPIMIAGKEPLTQKKCIGIVGVSNAYNALDEAVINAYRNAVRFIRAICPRVSHGGARNLITLIGHSLNGQAGSLTAESTSMILFTEESLSSIYRATTKNVVDEIMNTVYYERN